MWPFKQKPQRLILPRYTKDVWLKFNMGSSDDWTALMAPNNVTDFIKTSVVRIVKKRNRKPQCSSALIATIDDDYCQWLGDKKHSEKRVLQYVLSHDNIKLWDEKLLNSGMVNSYNILNVPISIIPCKQENNKTSFVLDKTSTMQIVYALQNTYQTQDVFCPGWILKGYDAPLCINDIISLAEAYWYENKHVTIGKYAEQSYKDVESRNKFAPHLFVIPFVIKTNIESALINLSGQYDKSEKTSHAMTFISFSNADKVAMLEVLKSKIDLIMGVGDSAIMPGQAHLAYVDNVEKLETQRKSFL